MSRPVGSKSVIVLWGAHRKPGVEASVGSPTPANVDKGVRELGSRGLNVVSLYPALMRNPLTRKVLGSRAIYRTTTFAVARRARSLGFPIYTSSLEWARIIARLKSRGVIRNRLIVRWAGIDSDASAIARGEGEGAADANVLRYADVCLFASTLLLQQIERAAPQYARKLEFWPTGVDSSYYRRIRAQFEAAPLIWDIAAVGSDAKRDWEMPLALARLGLRVALITEDPRAKAAFEEAAAYVSPNASLFFRAGFMESARIMAQSRCILIATLPNTRFSGSTTVGVAAALAKPVVLDDAEEAAGYGLVEGTNCEIFRRGDADGAYAAVGRALRDLEHAQRAQAQMELLADELDLGAYAAELERCLDSDWTRLDFRSRSDVPAQGPGADA